MNRLINVYPPKSAGYLPEVFKAVDDKFGLDIKILDISEISPIADYFVIATGSNPNQLRAIADGVMEALQKAGVSLRHSEGYNSLKWVLLDFGDIIVHVFDKESREFYNIERVWADAKEVSVNTL